MMKIKASDLASFWNYRDLKHKKESHKKICDKVHDTEKLMQKLLDNKNLNSNEFKKLFEDNYCFYWSSLGTIINFAEKVFEELNEKGVIEYEREE